MAGPRGLPSGGSARRRTPGFGPCCFDAREKRQKGAEPVLYAEGPDLETLRANVGDEADRTVAEAAGFFRTTLYSKWKIRP